MSDAPYLKYITGVAYRIAKKYHQGTEFVEDLLQEFFLALAKGQNTLLEHVAKAYLAKELKRGITGRAHCDFNMETMDSLQFIKSTYRESTTEEFVIYLKEIFIGMTEFDQKFIMLYLKGFTTHQIMNTIRKEIPISNATFYSERKRIFQEIDYSTYGDNYLKPKHYIG